ncbi:phosphoribosylaminoimidazolesuccinocarboxamide synthase [Methanohalophilus portucalensis]|uniref:Phosphoribosylaminoimidazole-succinocarboxamide synthase n=2 Tax=Methanohalophilus portucalensis TaxID=39664 RepID=A0A1L9C6Z1_9EURY|nr:phosphoribosylaminoimidazolesuccinocarboxamide synthase [Methanohalophilus portucalensis]ATU08779.1 phosphoribosylaminoimidazolesuccinocarboxamide synthase [Methanohalophilus portucalensis]OJH50181.1 phosphoribosylaminoimidazolesuccinocarboxamide synthase [Methanohalophilus portucalensis FDF-1]RNI13043.1 phosphoribosylaminoimidazolesuccinocarboxamide synthase [Methanohalophilus portucalensis FDF-1]SMH30804.1 phosphoribosylaminoimidazole-succinocarboxamide synthase [Methanohalophilus portucal
MKEMNLKYVSSGKAKDIYENSSETLLFEFTDRVTAFDGKKKSDYNEKGEITCKIAEYWFNIMENNNIPTHYIECPTSTSMIVKRLDIIPVEVIWRNYVAGSFLRRYEAGEIKLPEGVGTEEGSPIHGGMIEFTTKFEAVDRPINTDEIISNGWLSEKEITYITDLTQRINDIMSQELAASGIILADFKVEYGRKPDGEIILADEVGTPDGCRFWKKDEFDEGAIISLDKDVFRKSIGDLTVAYRELFNKLQKNNK